MRKTYREGTRVRFTGPASFRQPGSLGTVAKVATLGGKKTNPDPTRLMTFVKWDDGSHGGEFNTMLEVVPRCPPFISPMLDSCLRLDVDDGESRE